MYFTLLINPNSAGADSTAFSRHSLEGEYITHVKALALEAAIVSSTVQNGNPMAPRLDALF